MAISRYIDFSTVVASAANSPVGRANYLTGCYQPVVVIGGCISSDWVVDAKGPAGQDFMLSTAVLSIIGARKRIAIASDCARYGAGTWACGGNTDAHPSLRYRRSLQRNI